MVLESLSTLKRHEKHPWGMSQLSSQPSPHQAPIFLAYEKPSFLILKSLNFILKEVRTQKRTLS